MGSHRATLHARERYLFIYRQGSKTPLANGWRSGGDLAYFEFPNAQHNESAWAARLVRS